MPIRSAQICGSSGNTGIPTPFDSWHGRNDKIIAVVVTIKVGYDRSQSALGGSTNPEFGSLPQPVYPNILLTSKSS